MNKDRRKEIRRDTDRVLRQVVCVLQLPDKISRGEDVDYNDAYNELVEMKDRLGRRQEDQQLGTLLCSTFETLQYLALDS
jgi:hypothetical protein